VAVPHKEEISDCRIEVIFLVIPLKGAILELNKDKRSFSILGLFCGIRFIEVTGSVDLTNISKGILLFLANYR
jgi:hypothetical protein